MQIFTIQILLQIFKWILLAITNFGEVYIRWNMGKQVNVI